MKQRRFDPLDSARASMMLLGVFVHTALILPLFYKSLSQPDSSALWGIYQVIHVFRMPVFFFLAGIFAAALFTKSGFYGFLVSRWKRIVSVVLTAGVIIAAVLLPSGCTACSVTGKTGYLENGWLHLWFLFYLALISHFWLLVTFIWQKFSKENYKNAMNYVSSKIRFGAITLISLTLLTFAVPNYIGNDGALKMTFALIPDVSLLLVFSLFYLVGWLVFFNIDQAMLQLAKMSWLLLGVGVVSGAAAVYFFSVSNQLAEQLSYTLAMWSLTFGITGLFIKFFPKRTKVFGYFTDASYWVYLWHPIFILLFAWSGVKVGLPLWLSFVTTSVLSLTVVSLSYTYLVQGTKVDMWLSGRRRRELPLAEKAQDALVQPSVSG